MKATSSSSQADQRLIGEGRQVAWVDIRSKIVARNACRFFNGDDVLSGKRAVITEHFGDRTLSAAYQRAESNLAAQEGDSLLKRRGIGVTHECRNIPKGMIMSIPKVRWRNIPRVIFCDHDPQ